MNRHLCLSLLLALMLPLVAAEERDAIELQWDDLMPAGFSYADLRARIDTRDYDLSSLSDEDPEAQRLYDDMRQVLAEAPVVEQLDGARVRLAGFVVPLELDEDRVLSFLLVPYFGACIHTPPPPSNQIVRVESQGGFEAPGLDEPVYVTGMLRVEHRDSELGAAGYTLYASTMQPYL